MMFDFVENSFCRVCTPFHLGICTDYKRRARIAFMPLPDNAKIDKENVVILQPRIFLGTLLERPQGVFSKTDQYGMPDSLHFHLSKNPLAFRHRFRLEHSGLNHGRDLFNGLPRLVARVVHRFEDEFFSDCLLRVIAH
jgi:hypothetical protein